MAGNWGADHTHTPVEAGFDRFHPELIAAYFDRYATSLGISLEDFLALGRARADDSSETFNMAYLALRGSGSVNAVSRLHGRVSRRIFQPLFPRWPQVEVPVGYVTNGVHVPSWDSAHADDFWTESCGKGRWIGTLEDLKQAVHYVTDEEFWNLRMKNRQALVEAIRRRFTRHHGELTGGNGHATIHF